MTAVVARLRAAGCVFAEDEARLLLAAAGSAAELEALVEARCGGRPLEHLLGWTEFCGLRVLVAPGVFVPRRRTELLVREATALARPGAVVVDLCCGSGAVGVALAGALGAGEPRLVLHAVDVDPVAVGCARRNIGAAGEVHEGDLFDALPPTLRGRVDLLVANTPYVPTGEIDLMPPEARLHESRVALDGGTDGLDVARRVSAAATRWLAPGGHLLVETSERQASAVTRLFARDGLVPRVAHCDGLGATVAIGANPSPGSARRPPASG